MKNTSETHMTENLSILFFGTQMATGGAQKVLLDQARWFKERGYKVAAAFFYDKENLCEKWQAESEFPIYVMFSKHGKLGLYGLVVGLWNLWVLLRRNKFDVIETFTHDSNMLVLPIASLAGVKIRIATHHGVIDGFPRWRERIHSWMINHNIAHVIVAVSEKTRQSALKEGIHLDRIRVIQNGIAPVSIEGVNRFDIRKEVGFDEGDIVLLSVGRLVYQKAHEILISAMPAVLKEFQNVKLGICGDGLLRADLKTQIQSLNLSGSVKLLGKRDDVSTFLAASDVFVLPSRWEGLPIALLEAMGGGLPIIATEVEGVDEVIVQGEQGLLVPVENADALSQAILQLLRQPELRVNMGLAAKKRLRDLYSIDRMCERYLTLMLEFNSYHKG
ncbi:MAG: glycosyltransferase [Anaerolineales bacterium]